MARRKTSKKEAKVHPIHLLSFDMIEVINLSLSPADRKALALTHPVFAQYYRSTRTSCVARIGEPGHLKLLSQSLSKNLALKKLGCVFLYDEPALHRLHSLPINATHLSLKFMGMEPERSAYAALGQWPGNKFSKVTSLELESLCKSHPLNMKENLEVLSNMPNLQHLKLGPLVKEQGLHRLTQLQSLHIIYRNHSTFIPRDHLCPGCGDLHDENVDDFLHDCQNAFGSILGSQIARLPNLKELTLDFGVSSDDIASFSALRNYFDFSRKDAFPALTTISFLNGAFSCDPFWNHTTLPPFLRFSGCDMWRNATVAYVFEKLPSLQNYKLEAGSWQLPLEKLRDGKEHHNYLNAGNASLSAKWRSEDGWNGMLDIYRPPPIRSED